MIPPEAIREQLVREAHGGRFGGYLGDVKVHSELQCHYWWLEMCKGVSIRGVEFAWCVLPVALDKL